MEIHVLDVAIRVKEIVTLPMRRQYGQRRVAKFRRNLVATAEDHILVIPPAQEGSYGTVARVVSTLPLEGARQADLLIVIGKITWSLTIDLSGIATEVDAGRSKRK